MDIGKLIEELEAENNKRKIIVIETDRAIAALKTIRALWNPSGPEIQPPTAPQSLDNTQSYPNHAQAEINAPQAITGPQIEPHSGLSQPATAPNGSDPYPNHAQEENRASTSPTEAPKKPGQGRPRGRYKKDREFEGVYTNHLLDGTPVYRANTWDPIAKKNIGLGTYKDKLEAALVVAKSKNDTFQIELIEKLMSQRQHQADAQEQRENNPNRPEYHGTKSNRKTKAKPGATKAGKSIQEKELTYECKNCFHSFLSKGYPTECPNPKCHSAHRDGFRQL